MAWGKIWKSLFGPIEAAPKPEKAKIHPLDEFALPGASLPAADMKRVILHWTAGSHTASGLDKDHYHFLIQINDFGEPEVVAGNYIVSDNIPPLLEGEYAAHTRRSNSNSIGVSICAMAGATDAPLSAGKYPITKGQWDRAVKVVAKLCRAYEIDPSDTTVLTHAEVQANLGIKQNGKWDIAFLPFLNSPLSASLVGDKLRKEVQDELAGNSDSKR